MFGEGPRMHLLLHICTQCIEDIQLFDIAHCNTEVRLTGWHYRAGVHVMWHSFAP